MRSLQVSPADMLLFAAVVREGSFTRAAKQLGVTKQTASERIGKLEERLGVRLLERTTRRLRVTDAGSAYYERTNTIAALVDEANREVQQKQAEPQGTLRVSAPVLYGRHFLAPIISVYMASHPRVRVDVLLTDRRVDLVEDGFDLAVRIGALGDSSLSARKLGDGHVYYVASRGYLAQHGLPRPHSLAEHRCVGMRSHETWLVSGSKVRVEPALVVNDLEVTCQAAIAGVGIARLPSLVCREAIEDGRLQVLFGGAAAERPAVYAVFPSRRHLPVKVRAFIDLLATRVAPMQPADLTAAMAVVPSKRRAVRTTERARPSRRDGSARTRR
jgi:DNA-binding transcriptional LysR family regulator